MVDMLNQNFYYKTKDVGKTSLLGISAVLIL